MATHSSIPAWRVPLTEGLGGLQSWGRKESHTTERLIQMIHITYFKHDALLFFKCVRMCLWWRTPGGSDGKGSACSAEAGFDLLVGKIPWRREWQPLQYSCLENPMDREELAVYSPRCRKESDTTEWLTISLHFLNDTKYIAKIL